MAFITTVAEEQAEGLLQDIYQNAQKSSGYVPNYTKAFSLRPDVYAAWMNFLGSIRSKMRLRRYELVTFAATMALKCAY